MKASRCAEERKICHIWSYQISSTQPLAGANTLCFRGRWTSLPHLAPGWLYAAHGKKFPSWHTILWNLITLVLPSQKRNPGDLYCFVLLFLLLQIGSLVFCFSKRSHAVNCILLPHQIPRQQLWKAPDHSCTQNWIWSWVRTEIKLKERLGLTKGRGVCMATVSLQWLQLPL